MTLDNTTINNVALLGIGILSAWSVWQSKHNRKETSRENQEIKQKTEIIHKLVNQPMGVALSAAAGALEQVARMSGNDPERVEQARLARKASDDHNATTLAAEVKDREERINKDKIIKEYRESLKEKNGH